MKVIIKINKRNFIHCNYIFKKIPRSCK